MKMGRLLDKASSQDCLGDPQGLPDLWLCGPGRLDWSWRASWRLWAGRCERPGGERRGTRPGEMRAGPEREEGGADPGHQGPMCQRHHPSAWKEPGASSQHQPGNRKPQRGR